MVIELSGVQFGQKSRDFKTKRTRRANVISDQNCMTWSSIANLLHPFWNCTQKSETRSAFTSRYENMLVSCPRDVIASCDWLFCFTVLFSLAKKNMRFRAKIMRLGNELHHWADQTARMTSDFKMDLINHIPVIKILTFCWGLSLVHTQTWGKHKHKPGV